MKSVNSEYSKTASVVLKEATKTQLTALTLLLRPCVLMECKISDPKSQINIQIIPLADRCYAIAKL